jgi:hypothetical protein
MLSLAQCHKKSLMSDSSNQSLGFLLQTFLILRAIFRREDNPQIRWKDGHLYLDRKELITRGVGLSDSQLADRIRELARRTGLFHSSAHALAGVWRDELSKRALSASELIKCGQVAAFQRDPHEIDLVKRWRAEFMPRLATQLYSLNAVERFDESATSEDWEKKTELAPLMEDWPRRVLEDPYWKYAEAPLPEMEPLALDDVWVDLFLSDPLESLEEERLAEYFELRDERQRWLTEPAAFVLERIYGATALIGPPGCGKTTLLKWFARQMISNPHGRFLLPLFVPLRKYAQSRLGPAASSPGSLLEFALRQCGITHPAQLRMWMTTISYLTVGERNRVLIMLDGWDEVPVENRDLLLKEIDDLAYGFSVIITSRPSGFPRLLPVSHFYEIASLSHDNSERLIRRWFAAVGTADQAEAVLHLLDEHPDLRRLARNPFLLSLLCGSSSWRTEHSAISRTSIYRHAIDLIVAHHNRHYARAITSVELRQVERLALWLQADAPNAPRYVFDRATAQLYLNETATLETILPSRLLSQLRLDQESFHFLHTTFQEYLAARGLLAEPPARLAQRMQKWAYDLGWQEILCFAAAEAGEKKIKQVIWQRLAAMAQRPDRYGLIFVRLARFIVEAGVDDGGSRLLGVDVREELWHAINRGIEVNAFVDAYAELDPLGLLNRIERHLSEPCDSVTKIRYLRARGRVRSRESSQALVNTVLYGDDRAAAIATNYSYRVLDADGFNALRAAVSDESLSEQQRIRALRTLAGSRDSHIVGALKQIAAENSTAREPLPIEAIKALGRIGDSAASAALSELLSETTDSTRQVLLISVLGQARDPVSRDRLLDEIVSRLPDDPLVPAALEALVAKPFYEGTETVAELLKCEDLKVRAAAALAIGNSARTVYGQQLGRIALEDEDRSVRIAALQSLVNQGGPQSIYQLAQIVNDGSRGEDEQARALATSLLIFARLNAARDAAAISVLSRLTLAALQTPRGPLAFEAVSHAHLLGTEIVERLVEICQDEEASNAVREESCRSLARILRYREHEVKSKMEAVLPALLRLDPNATNDEEQPIIDPHARLAQAAADALAEINPERLLQEPGTTSRNALAAFSVRTGCLVFEDRIIGAHGGAFAGETETSDGASGNLESSRISGGDRMLDKAQIFLSYAREDEAKVKALYRELTEAGLNIWMDTERLVPGQQWPSEIERALKHSDVVIICLSHVSIQKRGFMQRELKKTLDRLQEKLETDIYLIPARLDDCEIPESLSNIQWVDLFKEGGTGQLIRAIRTALSPAEGSKRPYPISGGTRVIPKSKDSKIKILLLSANPAGTGTLKLDEETREIMAKVRASAHHNIIQIVTAGAVRPDDLLQAMNEHEPHVVHFSGHGSRDEGILVCDETGNAKAIGGDALAALFESTQSNVQVVVLNACYSRPQAEAIATVVPCVIGMKGTIGDRAARAFAASFYSALGFGHSVAVAFKQGLARLKLEGIQVEGVLQSDIPNLITRSDVNASEIVPVTAEQT